MPYRRSLALAALIVLLGACVPPEESNDEIKRYDPETSLMGQIQARGVMRIGIPSDHPPWAIVEGDLEEPEGFVVDMGTLAAEALGVTAELIPAPNDELLALVELDVDDPEAETAADLVFPMIPITEELVRSNTFTDPYWVGHTRALSDGSREVASGPDVELLARAFGTDLEIVGEQQSTEGYGAAVRTGASTFATIVSQVFNEADAEGDWSRFYERWVAEYFAEPAPEDVPIMTVEDAAALYPADLD